MADNPNISLAGPTSREEEIIAESLREFQSMVAEKSPFSAHCEEVAELILPTQRGTFYPSASLTPGIKKTDRQVDASGALALSRFSAICSSLLTPQNMTWHTLSASDPKIMKDRACRLWFEQATRALFRYRYAPQSNFISQNNANFTSLGAFGNLFMFTDELDTRHGKGIRYKAVPFGEVFFHENHQGVVDGFIRFFRYTARQVYQKFPDTFPEQMRGALEMNSEQKFDIIHRCCPQTDYDPERYDSLGKPYASYYIAPGSRTLLEEGGYRMFPGAAGRYEQSAGEVYGRGPAMMVLPALKTLNAEKRVFLKQGHRAGDPVLLTADDGLIDFNMRPGALNKGGMSSDGKPLVGILPTGNIQITKEMMADEKGLINDAFLVTLFQILTETPQMTATEVIERTNEKGILLAPTVGRQSGEYLGNMIPRELDILSWQGLLEPMPPLLKEADGEYHVIYTSPMARAMQAQETAGFMRSVEMSKEIVNITQDPSYLDPYDFDTATPAIARNQGVPESWLLSEDKIAAKRQARAKQAQMQEAIQAAPAAAAMMKARAVSAKAGVPAPQAPQAQPAPGSFPQ